MAYGTAPGIEYIEYIMEDTLGSNAPLAVIGSLA